MPCHAMRSAAVTRCVRQGTAHSPQRCGQSIGCAGAATDHCALLPCALSLCSGRYAMGTLIALCLLAACVRAFDCRLRFTCETVSSVESDRIVYCCCLVYSLQYALSSLLIGLAFLALGCVLFYSRAQLHGRCTACRKPLRSAVALIGVRPARALRRVRAPT